MEIIKLQLDREEIIEKANENLVPYFDLPDEERTYFTKCAWLIDYKPFIAVENLHKDVTAIVKYLSTRRDDLLQILDPKIVDVILQRPWPISHIQRYDLLINRVGKYKVVEVNSETPAGIPESVNAFLFDNGEHQNTNTYLYDSIRRQDIVAVVCADDEWEDLTNATYIANAYWIWSFVVNIEELQIRDWYLYVDNYDEKIDKIHSFYPLEWIFADEWWDEFWQWYVDHKFDIMNWPINLISQSKAFWAWVYENIWTLIERWIINSYENIQTIVPKYYFKEQIWTISKPRLFREWVWIWEEAEWNVFQEYIQQKEFEIETYEWPKTWYITLWIYCDEENSIGTYCRFCENKITDYTSYYLPIYNTNEKETLDPNELACNSHSWLM